MSRIEELVDEVRRLGPLPTEDDADPLRVCPPATQEEVATLEAACGHPLPPELLEFLRATAGFEHPELEWKPTADFVEPQGFGALLRASNYGNGDGFGLEPCGDRCRVWWAGHDSWFLVYWASSIEAFLELWLERARQTESGGAGERSAWAPTSYSEPVRAEADMDAELASFVESLPPESIVYDLRRAALGIEIQDDEMFVRGGSIHRRDLLVGLAPPPRPVMLDPVPVSDYARGDLTDAEQATLRSLPKGSLVLHQRDLPRGGSLDSSAYPGRDVAFRPPFHVVYPKRRWWQRG